jgi:hypothetical protein
VAVELGLILTLIYVQPFQRIFDHGPLALANWAVLIALIPTLLVADEIRKFFFRRRHPLVQADVGLEGTSSREPIIKSERPATDAADERREKRRA